MDLRAPLAELVGTAFLVAAVVGSGIAATRMSPDQPGLQLLQIHLRRELVEHFHSVGDIRSLGVRLNSSALQLNEQGALCRSIRAPRRLRG